MHYIRFLKPPRRALTPRFSAKITITTDLGESFLAENIFIIVALVSPDGVEGVNPREYLWKGRDGMRALVVTVNVAKIINRGRMVAITVRAKDERYHWGSFESLLSQGKGNGAAGAEKQGADQGGIVPVRSLPLWCSDGVPPPAHVNRAPPRTNVSLRVFTARSAEEKEVELVIAEDIGESIARHIWDAGLLLSSYLALISPSSASIPSTSSTGTLPSLPTLQRALSHPSLHILELGAGCGIVGLTLAKFYTNISELLLTDLDEAMEALGGNIERAGFADGEDGKEKREGEVERGKGKVVRRRVLDWAGELPGDVMGNVGGEGGEGEKGEVKARRRWDLIVVADCTYNSDVVPDLVRTLRGLVSAPSPTKDPIHRDAPHEALGKKGKKKENENKEMDENQNTLILLAMKVRHDSELVFFDLMAEAGFVVVERCVLPLGMVGGVGEEIEIFVFGLVRSGNLGG